MASWHKTSSVTRVPKKTMSEPQVTKAHAGRRRLLAVLLGVVLTPLLLEFALQAASLFVSSDRELQEGDCLVLCQGDSHTYGLWLPPDSAYPAQLEALLTERDVELSSVLNRGIPGKTTWQMLDELEPDIERWNPKAVCLWGGVNDRTGRRPDSESTHWWSTLRTVRLLHNLADRVAPQVSEEAQVADTENLPETPTGDERDTFDVANSAITRIGTQERRLDFEGRDGEMQHLFMHGGNPSVEQYTYWIQDDLERAARLAQSRGAVPLLMTYPVDDPPRLEINRAIERAAQNTGARFVDLRTHFEEAAKIHGWGPLLYGRGHPKELGYSIIAHVVLAALVDEGIVEVDVPDPLEAVHAWSPSEFVVSPWSEDGEIVGIEVNYTPGHRVQVLFSQAAVEDGIEVTFAGSIRLLDDVGERFEKQEWAVPLADGETFRNALRRTKRYMTTLDGEGHGRIRMHPELAELEQLFAVAFTLTPREGISRMSSVIELR